MSKMFIQYMFTQYHIGEEVHISATTELYNLNKLTHT